MTPDIANYLSVEDKLFFVLADLKAAEDTFQDLKTLTLSGVTELESFAQAREHLREIEDILAEKHEARRARQFPVEQHAAYVAVGRRIVA